MKKKIAILGSTGSIGKSLLKVISKNKKNYEIKLLTSNKNYKLLLKQAREFKVKNLLIRDENKFNIVKKKYSKKYNIFNNYSEFNKIFNTKMDYVMNSIVGFSGLEPTIKIIRFTKKIAIANKESVLCGWNLINNELKKNKTIILPVDSEHFSIWLTLNSFKIHMNKIDFNKYVDNLVITASGGPFKNTSIKNFYKIKVEDAINHPTWKMGKKISVDSATLVNKVFEVIEAQRLFGIKIENISIKIHKESYIHSIIKFKSGIIKIIAHEPNMIIPIQKSLNPKKSFAFKNKINFKILNNLEFCDVDKYKFQITKILKNYPNKCTLFDTAFVSINDELVKLFLEKKINFKEISKKLIYLLNTKEIKLLKKKIPKNYNEISEINNYVRLKTNKLCIC